MCCTRKSKQRQEAGKCRSMEIDEGPPPFIGGSTTNNTNNSVDAVNDDNDDDAFNKNPLFDDDDVDSSMSSSNLPLPDAVRSRSVSPAPENQNQMTSAIPKTSVVVEDDEDEWGDFGEAVAAPVSNQNQNHIPPTPTVIPPLQMNDDDDDDEWGAFDQARPSTDRTTSEDADSAPNSSRSQEARQLAHQQSLEEWGAFENENAKKNDSEDEWQAEFSSAATVIAAAAPEENFQNLEQMLEDEAFWDDGYSEGEMDFEKGDAAGGFDIPSLFDSEALEEVSAEFEDAEKRRYSKLWLSLRVIEEAISLKFDWKQSEIRKNHFKALKINPITVKKETRATAAAIFDTSNLLMPTPIQQQNATAAAASSTSSTESPTKANDNDDDSPSVPAVDFDWDTSGLTNPMNRANQSSAIIDVDFLGSNGVATAYTSTLQHDLEQFGLTNGATSSGKMMSNGSSILETLMSSRGAAANGAAYRTPEVLSLDARQLLARLPDLQYLQSEVLMFPVGTNLPH